jgi:long-chain acyl-CoA synthetase
MYPGVFAAINPDRPAFIMARSGETVSYGEFEARSNRLAHLLRAQGLKKGDHYAILLENHPRFMECNGAGARSGLYYTCLNSYLKPDEVTYIVNNSESQVLITSMAKLEVARAALVDCPKVKLCLVVDAPEIGAGELGEGKMNLDAATAGYPETPIADETLGGAMLYSSGTTGKPKGVLRPLPDAGPDFKTHKQVAAEKIWRLRREMTYLSPAPLYHAAPNSGANYTLRLGGTLVIMEKFDPEFFLQLVEKYKVSHTQLVPTMFSRMLKLPPEVRNAYDLSSLEVAIHAAAPCPIPVKEQMIEWWGPIILEYYGATDGNGVTTCDSYEALAHPGTVGKMAQGEIHILDADMQPCPAGTVGAVWFTNSNPFEYFNDPERTKEALSPDGTKTTVGDMGYLDTEGYLYLTDRATFMIISGGVNIYPQECENLLITHPKVADAAVFGVPNEDLGEEVKAVVQPMPGEDMTPELADQLMAFCNAHLSRQKCPRSIDFTAELPRLPTGKLYKKQLRDSYWADHKSRIL